MKQKNNPSQILKNKEDKLDWQTFNFLENLLVFCALEERSVPKESGVNFHITNPQTESLCILFNIDRKEDPLIRDNAQKRPDYMSLYINKDSCICTIIEMKGTNKNCLNTGVEQIVTFRDKLKAEIVNHFTPKFKIQFQGILLTPYNAQIPQPKIAEEAKKGFVILPLQYNHKAELYPYISKLNKTTDRYENQKFSDSTSPLLIEDILTERALPKRMKDSPLYAEYSNNKSIIYIDYLLPNRNEYLTFWSDPKQVKIILNQNEFKEKIRSELNTLNLINKLDIKFS